MKQDIQTPKIKEIKKNNQITEIREFGIFSDKILKGIISSPKGLEIMNEFFDVVTDVTMPQNITLVDKEVPVTIDDGKAMRLDMLLDSEEMRIDVEFNSSISDYIWFRNEVYFFSSIASDQKEGEAYKIGKKYLLANFNLNMKETDPLIEVLRIVNPKKPMLKDNNFYIYILNLDKARKLWDNGNRSKKIMYMAAFTMTNKELEKIQKPCSFIKELKEVLDKMSKNDFWFTPEEDAMKLFNAFKQRELGKYCAEAEEKGIKIGEEKGIKIGEKNTIINLIKKMLLMGKNYDEIMEITDVDKQTIDMLAKQL